MDTKKYIRTEITEAEGILVTEENIHDVARRFRGYVNYSYEVSEAGRATLDINAGIFSEVDLNVRVGDILILNEVGGNWIEDIARKGSSPWVESK